ncbi:HNH endonuclease [candidate division TA06 bacterium]|uniref:HNH endonuclease n=1 Tax=candidate division TA06 bacterium TaxID=2250710 RepID=A0A523UVU7_UNCT6|nr:MAG: HNH endonuclease [candidate division TA06 bacterium]
MPFSEKTKTDVRKKSHFSCCLCQALGIEVHHIIPEQENGTNTFDNAAPLCPTCHETFGSNPRKRKMIREARDSWYEICEQRYISDQERFKADIADKIIKRLKSQGLLTQENNREGLPLSHVVEKILSFEKERVVPNKESIDVTYILLYQTKGDPKSADDKEYGKLREVFLRKFGTIVARNICIYLVNETEIDWFKGVADSTISGLLIQNQIIMAAIYVRGRCLAFWHFPLFLVAFCLRPYIQLSECGVLE